MTADIKFEKQMGRYSTALAFNLAALSITHMIYYILWLDYVIELYVSWLMLVQHLTYPLPVIVIFI